MKQQSSIHWGCMPGASGARRRLLIRLSHPGNESGYPQMVFEYSMICSRMHRQMHHLALLMSAIISFDEFTCCLRC